MHSLRSLFSVLIFFLWSLTPSDAQMNKMTEKRTAEFLASTTYVELTDYDDLNTAIKTAFQKYWAVTPHKFVTTDELKEVLKDPKISLFRLISFAAGKASLENENAFFAIFMGGRKKLDWYEKDDILTSEYLDFAGGEKWVYESGYRVDFLIKTMNDYLLGLKNNIKDTANQPTLLKNKTLLVAKETLAAKASPIIAGTGKVKAFEEKALEGYKYPYKVLPLNEIKKIIEDTTASNKQFCLLAPKVSEAIKTFYVYDLESKKRIYWWVPSKKSSIRPPFTKKDFEEASEEIEGKKK